MLQVSSGVPVWPDPEAVEIIVIVATTCFAEHGTANSTHWRFPGHVDPFFQFLARRARRCGQTGVKPRPHAGRALERGRAV
jgi:hypothetical protein